MPEPNNNLFLFAKSILQHENLLHTIGSNKVYLGLINEGDICHLGIIAHPKGFLIETSFPALVDSYNRLWLLEPFLQQVSYLEVDNPSLKKSPTMPSFEIADGQDIEMYAMPEDIKLLGQILRTVANNPARWASKPSQANLKTHIFITEKIAE